MTGTMTRRAIRAPGWPMTRAALVLLREEVEQLRSEIAVLAGRGIEEGIVLLPVVRASQRLETLQTVLDRAEVIDDDRRAAIGRRVSLRAVDGEEMTCRLVFPGDGDPARGWISADSPLGSALLWAEEDDAVSVEAPGGAWTARVIGVE